MRKYLIIDVNNLKRLFSEAREEMGNSSFISGSASLSFAFTLLLTLLTTIQFKSIGSLKSESIQLILSVVCIIAFIYSIGAIIYYIKNRIQNKHFNLTKFEKQIIEASESKEEEILLFLLPRLVDRGFEFLVKPKMSWGGSLFLPYIPDIYGKDLTEKENQILIKITHEFKTQTPFKIRLLPSMDNTSIKKIPAGLPQNFRYRFILLYAESPFFQDVLKDDFINNGYNFKTLPEMLEDIPTKDFNSDIINILSTSHDFIKNEVKNLYNSRSKIIWNIFKKCNKGCLFCAYGEQDSIKDELNLVQKKQLITALKGLHIDEIDFATGDSPDINQLIEVIEFTKQTLNSNLNITTTAEVLDKIDIPFLTKNISSIELTYDFPKDIKNEYRPDNFSSLNYDKAKFLIRNGIKVEALVVLNKNIDSAKLKVIKTDLLKIGISRILLLRLMPVGLQKFNEYPRTLLKRSTYLDIMGLNSISTNEVKLHCSLQGLKSNCKACELATYKFGISSTGDVYSCPWAEHLVDQNNPFKIGNITREAIDLKELLLESNNYKNFVYNRTDNQPHCKIFAYLNGKNVFEKKDELYCN